MPRNLDITALRSFERRLIREMFIKHAHKGK